MFDKKGQSALEYLMTYGWALIVIAIVIGILIYVLSGQTGGSTCTISGTQITFQDSAIDKGSSSTGDEKLAIRLQNATGKTINTLATASPTGNLSGTPALTSTPINSGSMFDVNFTAQTLSGSYRGTFDLNYAKSGDYLHTLTVTCTGTA